MKLEKELICEKCNSRDFEVKREATYVYTYKIAPEHNTSSFDGEEKLPFLFDNREKTNSHEYLLCLKCGEKYPCSMEEISKNFEFTVMQKALRADNINNPEYLG